MMTLFSFKFPRLLRPLFFGLWTGVFFSCPNLWAAREAIVIVERALIYSDQEMTSPVGYVSFGKKLMIGEIPRNKAQVYPIVVSGRVAYIRVADISLEKDRVDADHLKAQRFQKQTLQALKSRLSFGYLNFSSKVSLKEENHKIQNDDTLSWHGLTLKGEVLFKEKFDLQIVTDYMQTSSKGEAFRVFDFGLGAGWRLINARRFVARVEAQLLGIPYASYAIQEDFRINSWGYSALGGGSLSFLGNHWGAELFGGLQYTHLMKFDLPDPYKDTDASFVGTRLGLNVLYTY